MILLLLLLLLLWVKVLYSLSVEIVAIVTHKVEFKVILQASSVKDKANKTQGQNFYRSHRYKQSS